MIIIIAESGSTKTDWAIINYESTIYIETIGINPTFMSAENMQSILTENILPNIPNKQKLELHFYGASCSSPEKKEKVKNAFQTILSEASINIEHDLLAAARATCQDEEGIAAILGTGSNSCLYDGEKITLQVGGHGFILGDEGSGAHMGKLLLKEYLECNLKSNLVHELENEYGVTKNNVIRNVYQEQNPNRYLASFAPFIHKYKNHPAIYALIKESIKAFIDRHFIKYNNVKNIPIHFVGSIAYFMQDILIEEMEDKNLIVGAIIKRPIDALIQYHLIHHNE